MIQSASSTWSTTDSCISSSSRRTSHFSITSIRNSGMVSSDSPTGFRKPVRTGSGPTRSRKAAAEPWSLSAWRSRAGRFIDPWLSFQIRERTKVVMDGQYRVTLAPRGEVAAEKPVVLTFSLARADGSPVSDLQPLMAAGGHCVVIRQDAQTFVHVHPTREVDPSWRGGPDVALETTFPTPRLYKVWGQFHHAGLVVTAAFVLDGVRREQSHGLTPHEERVRHHDHA